MFLTPLQFVQRLESAILEALRSYENLKDTALACYRFLDFNKKIVSLEVVLSLKEVPSKMLKGVLDVQQISADGDDQSAFSLRFRALEFQKERLCLLKTKEDLDREVKTGTLFFKYCFLNYLAQAQVPNLVPLEGSLESYLKNGSEL